MTAISEKLVDKWVHQYTDLGWSCRKISDMMYHDYSPPTIYHHIKKRGTAMRKQERRFNISMFIHDWNAGIPCKSMAKVYGFDTETQVRSQALRLRNKGMNIRKRKQGFQEGNKLYLLRKGKADT